MARIGWRAHSLWGLTRILKLSHTTVIPGIFHGLNQRVFSKFELLRLLEGLQYLLPNFVVPFVLWAPSINEWDKITLEINDVMPVSGFVDIAFGTDERAAYEALIYDIYAHDVEDLVSGFSHIDNKIALLSSYPGFMRIGCAIAPFEVDEQSAGLINQFKNDLRQKFSSKVPVDHFVTAHLASNAAEAGHMAATIFNVDNLHWAKFRKTSKPRQFSSKH